MSDYSKWRHLRSKGASGESVFIDDFLIFLSIPFKDVRDNELYRSIDVDFLLFGNAKFEIKLNGDEKKIRFLEYKNKTINKQELGWFYKSKADYFVFILPSKKFIILKNDDNFRLYYKKLRQIYPPVLKTEGNKIIVWREIPITKLYGYISIYERKH